ncbi:hypothetical protein, partial [Blautia wexlerae]|uniref:hypothetical protein n=1 Tax=Blautia wexlerae TaxID=418240 RepID=UPI001A9BCB36
LVYSQPRNIFVKRDVKLTEPPDAEPHVRWCERSAAKAVSYSITTEEEFITAGTYARDFMKKYYGNEKILVAATETYCSEL